MKLLFLDTQNEVSDMLKTRKLPGAKALGPIKASPKPAALMCFHNNQNLATPMSVASVKIP